MHACLEFEVIAVPKTAQWQAFRDHVPDDLEFRHMADARKAVGSFFQDPDFPRRQRVERGTVDEW